MAASSAPVVAGRRWRALAPAWLQAWWGRRRRQAGRYDQITLAWFTAAWRRQADSGTALCRLALFRRDLGRPLPRRWVRALTQAVPDLPRVWQQRALGLLAESAPTALWAIDPDVLDDAARGQPGVAAWNPPADVAGSGLGDGQPALRAAFGHWLRQRIQAGGLCTVGNAAGLAGCGLGQAIDRHAAVLRFNQWQGPRAAMADVGCRIDVWVFSPDVDAPVPAGLSWAIMTGPDPRFLQRRWTQAARLQAAGVPVLTVPLPIWRDAVRALQAPPSAGVLVLWWLQALLGGWDGLRMAGIGWGLAADGRHHLLASHRSSSRRHRWFDEAALVQCWRSQGLRDLGR